MEEEKKFFDQIKRLISEYVEYDNTEILAKWEEEKVTLQSEIEEKNKQFEEITESRKKAVEDLRVTDNIQKSLHKDTHAYKGSKQDFQEARKKSIVKNREYREVEQELKQAKENLSQRETSVNELIKTRTEQGKEKQKEIYSKTKEFINANKEKMNQEIVAKQKQLSEIEKNRKNARKEESIAEKTTKDLKLKRGETSHAYIGSIQDLKEAKEKVLGYNKEYKAIEKELKQAKGKLVEFESRYNVIDFESDGGIQSLMDITGWEKELTLEETLQKASKDLSVEEVQVMMSAIYSLKGTNMADKMNAIREGASYEEIGLDEESIEVMKKAIENMTPSQLESMTKQMQSLEENAVIAEWANLSNNVYTYKVKIEQIKTIFAEIEEGYEDLLSEDYLKEKQSYLEREDVDEALADLELVREAGLLNVYKHQLNSLIRLEKEGRATQDEIKELKELISKVEEREKELRKEDIHKLSDDKVEVAKPNGKGATNPEPKATKPEEKGATNPEPKATKPEEKGATNPEPKATKPEGKGTTNPEPKAAKPEEKAATNPEPKATKPEEKGANSDPKAPTKRVSMPIRKIEINANKRKVIVHFTRQGDWPKEYSIRELLNHKSTFIHNSKNDMPKDKDKNFERKVNPLWLGPLQDCNDREVYNMVAAYINNLDENNEKMQLPIVEYNLRNSRLSPKNYRKVLKYARNEEDLDNVDVDRKKTLWERFKDFTHKSVAVRAIGDGAKITGREIGKTSKKALKSIKNYATTLHEDFKGTKIGKQINRASTFVKGTRVGKQVSSFVKELKQGVPTQEEQAIRAGERKHSKMDNNLDNMLQMKDFQL